MLDPIVNFFTRIFQSIGRGIGLAVGVVLWPFMRVGRWYTQRGWILRAALGAVLLGIVFLYGYFFWNTQRWVNFNPDYVAAYERVAQGNSTGGQGAPEAGIIGVPDGAATTTGGAAAQTCRRSAIVDATADLVDFNVNQNAWISSMVLYKLGLFGFDWDRTPFFDNKAAFQRGVNQAVRRTAVERYARASAWHLTDRSQFAKRTGQSSIRRVYVVFRPEPLRSQDAHSELLPRLHQGT